MSSTARGASRKPSSRAIPKNSAGNTSSLAPSTSSTSLMYLPTSPKLKEAPKIIKAKGVAMEEMSVMVS